MYLRYNQQWRCKLHQNVLNPNKVTYLSRSVQSTDGKLPFTTLLQLRNLHDEDTISEADLLSECKSGSGIPEDGISFEEVYLANNVIFRVVVLKGETRLNFMGSAFNNDISKLSDASDTTKGQKEEKVQTNINVYCVCVTCGVFNR